MIRCDVAGQVHSQICFIGPPRPERISSDNPAQRLHMTSEVRLSTTRTTTRLLKQILPLRAFLSRSKDLHTTLSAREYSHKITNSSSRPRAFADVAQHASTATAVSELLISACFRHLRHFHSERAAIKPASLSNSDSTAGRDGECSRC